MAMRKPPHPGRQIKTALQAADINITEGAAHLGVTRNTLSRVINGLAVLFRYRPTPYKSLLILIPAQIY